jgi:hypothetical protein
MLWCDEVASEAPAEFTQHTTPRHASSVLLSEATFPSRYGMYVRSRILWVVTQIVVWKICVL